MKVWRALVPICAIVFLEFLAMGIPLAVLPGRVDGALGFGAFAVGIVIGAQSLITLFTRPAAGARTDERGPRSATLQGLALSVLAGSLAAVSLAVPDRYASLGILVLGRGLLGVGEGLVVSGALAWGIAVLGRERTGVVMAWVGIAMYGALAAGAPIALELEARVGAAGTFVAAALAPLAGLVVAMRGSTVQTAPGTRLPFRRVAALIWLPGAGLALCALGFAAIAAFSVRLFADHAWPHAGLAMTAFGVAYILARLLFGRLPDRLGGARVALVSTAIAAIGQLGFLLATSGEMAIAAAALTGFGFSLSFPAFGVEAMRRVPPQNRGVALGVYAACFDAALAFGTPILGVAAGALGHRSIFALTTIAVLGSLVIALVLAIRVDGDLPAQDVRGGGPRGQHHARVRAASSQPAGRERPHQGDRGHARFDAVRAHPAGDEPDA